MANENCCNSSGDCCFGDGIPFYTSYECEPGCGCGCCGSSNPKPSCVWAIDTLCELACCVCDPDSDPCDCGCSCSV